MSKPARQFQRERRIPFAAVFAGDLSFALVVRTPSSSALSTACDDDVMTATSAIAKIRSKKINSHTLV